MAKQKRKVKLKFKILQGYLVASAIYNLVVWLGYLRWSHYQFNIGQIETPLVLLVYFGLFTKKKWSWYLAVIWSVLGILNGLIIINFHYWFSFGIGRLIESLLFLTLLIINRSEYVSKNSTKNS